MSTAGPELCRSGSTRAADDALTRAEGAILATALLTNMGVPARLVRATLDGEATLLCAWKDDQWYGAPIWPTARVQAQSDEPVAEWRDDRGDGKARSRVGWEVLAAYERVSMRRLPVALAGLRCEVSCERFPACKGTRNLGG